MSIQIKMHPLSPIMYTKNNCTTDQIFNQFNPPDKKRGKKIASIYVDKTRQFVKKGPFNYAIFGPST